MKVTFLSPLGVPAAASPRRAGLVGAGASRLYPSCCSIASAAERFASFLLGPTPSADSSSTSTWGERGMGGRTDRRTDEWSDGQTGRRRARTRRRRPPGGERGTGGRTDRRTDRRADGRADAERGLVVDVHLGGEGDGWTDGQTDRRVVGWTDGPTPSADSSSTSTWGGEGDGWTDGQTDGQTDRRADAERGLVVDVHLEGEGDGWTDGQTDRRADGRTDGWTDGQADGWTDGRTDETGRHRLVVDVHLGGEGDAWTDRRRHIIHNYLRGGADRWTDADSSSTTTWGGEWTEWGERGLSGRQADRRTDGWTDR